jgi:CheY-like chemotaxis protein
VARVLVIEDNPANMELMTYLLRAFGHSVLEATDGRQGVQAALESRPDLIICDLQLPLVDGYEVARKLKQDASMRAVPLLARRGSACGPRLDSWLRRFRRGSVSRARGRGSTNWWIDRAVPRRHASP